jgi:hypothetical protein
VTRRAARPPGPRRCWCLRLGTLSALVVLVMGFTASCSTGPGISLSFDPGAVSACYRGLPAARTALHEDSAKLTGVHRVPYDTLHKRLPTLSMPAVEDDSEVCTFAFDGQFQPGQVTDAPPSSQGTVAVVVISIKKLVLVTSWVGDHLPSAFGRRVA